jgi:hypothetical protein
MSSPLAIAGVTAVLRDLLNNALVDQDVSGSLGGNVTVSALPPDRVIPPGGPDPDQLNVFMHQVAPNTGWSNVGLASRDARGDRLANPPLALDLHYLLTAYGVDSLHAEVLLGYGMHVLHENPVLTRGAIRHALSGPSGVNGSLLPPALAGADATNLADQVEQIKITPIALGTEELSKLWSALGANYRPTAAYLVSVVLIEATEPARTPLPVLSRGAVDLATGKDAGVAVQPSLIPPYPTLEEIIPPAKQFVARMGERVEFVGHHLDAPQTFARFTDFRNERTIELATSNAAAGSFDVDLPPVPPVGAPGPNDPLNPENWRIGHYEVVGVLRDPNPAVPDRLSNELVLTLAPRIGQPVAVAAPAGQTTLQVAVAPPVWLGQQVSLVVGTTEIISEPLAADRVSLLQFTAPTAEWPTGQQWVRLTVDGVSSILIDRSGPFPVFDPTQVVVL